MKLPQKGTTPLKSAVDPCILEIRRDLEIGSELKVFVDACLERLKVICRWEDGRMKRVAVSRCHSHRDSYFYLFLSAYFCVLKFYRLLIEENVYIIS